MEKNIRSFQLFIHLREQSAFCLGNIRGIMEKLENKKILIMQHYKNQ